MPDSATARALVLDEPRRLVIREFPLPEIGDDDGLAAGRGVRAVRHRPRAVHRRARRPGSPSSPATRPSASSRRSGRRAAERWGVAEGDRVAVEVFLSCRACDACLAGEYRRCERHGLADMYGFIRVDRAPGLWGGYAEYQYLAPDSMLLPVPDALDPVARHAVQPARRRHPLGRHAAGHRAPATSSPCSGPASAGCRVAAAAKEAGAGFVMVTGVRAARRRAARRSLPAFGADLAVDVATTILCAALRDADRPAGRRRRRRHRQGARGVRARRSRSPAPAARSSWPAPGAADRRRPASCPTSRLQGAAHPRRARRRRAGLPRRRSTCWRRGDTRSPTCHAGASGSTGPTICLPPWPATATTSRPCTGW